MSASGATLAHRSVANIRGGGTPGGPSTPGPHTPPRASNLSSFGSPSTVRADDEILVIELGARYLRVGFAGDSTPKAALSCGPAEQRRVGDFGAWQEPRRGGTAWSPEHEFWRFDLRELDLGLVEDKLDRMLRDAFTRYLLIDSRPRRVGLVLDSAVPIPMLSTVLNTLFYRFQTPSVSLISTGMAASIAAGVRSAVVINMGWAETIITTIYEYREVKTTRTVRGGRLLVDQLYEILKGYLVPDMNEENHDSERVISFEECEDIMCRLMWCRPSAFKASQRLSAQLETVEEQDESEAESAQNSPSSQTVRIPLTTSSTQSSLELPMERFANICDDAFFDTAASPSTFDDHELPVHLLLYQHLLQLPMDIRAVCMSRIIFTGGCSNILGLKERIVDEVTSMVERRGWESVSGKGADEVKRKAKLQEKGIQRQDGDPQLGSEAGEEGAASRIGPAYEEPVHDQIDAKLARLKKAPSQVKGQLRAIHSLGPWAGGSLLSQLKIPAMAAIDRDLWLQHGAHGASRPSEVDVKAQRQSMAAGGLIRGNGHTSWTLGVWGAM
jgi:actin-related protein